MADDGVTFADDFPPVSYDQWRLAVDAVLRGKDFSELRSVTADGISLEPLYSAGDAPRPQQFPAAGISRRASGPTGRTGGWDVRQHHSLTTTSGTNAAILDDLQSGVTSIELDTSGVDELATLDAVLQDVLLDLAPVALVGPDDGMAAARLLLALAAARDVRPEAFVADLGCDPIGRLASTGRLVKSPADAVDAVAGFALEISDSHPGVRTLRANGGPYADAGASPSTEIAATVVTAVTYIRSMMELGLDPARAFGQLLLSVTVGTDQFGDVAKLRALRVVWARVSELSGVAGVEAAVQATTAASSVSDVDPWTNMLRVTVGCVAAAIGGADIITVSPFDSALGVPDDLGTRIARNTQLALMEESGLHRVIDPAGGSWYVEELTDRLAAEAWAIIQELERNGGVIASLLDGSLRTRIDASWEATRHAIASGERAVVGVNKFRDSQSAPLRRNPYPRRPELEGALLVEPLPRRRLATAYEAPAANQSVQP